MIAFGTMAVFVYAGFTNQLPVDVIKDAFLFIAGAIVGRGRQPAADAKEKPE